MRLIRPADRVREPMNEDDYTRLANYGTTVISPSKLEYYGSDPEVIVAELKAHGFTRCRCHITKDDVPSLYIEERLPDAAIIEGRRKKR